MTKNILNKALVFMAKALGVCFLLASGMVILLSLVGTLFFDSGEDLGAGIGPVVIGLALGAVGFILFFRVGRGAQTPVFGGKANSRSGIFAGGVAPAESCSPMMVPCEACKKQISSAAEKCPSCGHPVTEKWVKIHRDVQNSPIPGLMTLLVGIPIVVWVVFALHDTESSSEQEARSRAAAGCGDEIAALTFAQLAVEEKLKSPSDADFPWPGDEVITKTGECEYSVKSYVDAPNSFGATVRTHFVVRLRYDKNQDAWAVQSVRFAE